MKIVVGPSEMHVVDTSEVILLTSSLGSGIGIAAYDSNTRVGGILHFLLPSSGNFKSRAQKNPLLFADTGIPIFLEKVFQKGANKQDLKIVIAGGSQIIDQEAPYDIARRNLMAVEGLLVKNSLSLSYQDLGGNFYRQMRIEDGHIYVEIPGHGEMKI